MKLFKFSFGSDDRYAAFESAEQAYEHRKTVDLVYEWTPVVIEEVTVEGYEINLTPVSVPDKPIPDMNRDELKQYLKARGITYTAQWGEDKLRELALQHA